MRPDLTPPAQEPRVGVFWFVPDGNTSVLISGSVPLSRAEPYGDCLTYPRGHYELWEEWRRMLASDLIGNGLPVSIIGHEYEEFPRGRVVYQRPAKRFVIYADRKLFDAAIIARIVEQFALAHEIREVRSDDHYRT